ncbi:MAG: alpha/beta hydrolase [Lachnospiraceae bacterium]|nr:alpha/beta hydrolase [Lachnospiraceae bacterium]
MLHAKNGQLTIDDTTMDYICFGTGAKNLIMIPGLGDGLTSVKGKAIPFALLYRQYAKEYTIYVFSRKNKLQEDAGTRTMAADLVKAMELLKIEKADIVGVSQGGMIAQYLAIDFPEKVHKLVLVVTLSKQNEVVGQVIESWIEMAKNGDYAGIFTDTAEKSYTEDYLQKSRWFFPIVSKMSTPKEADRFLIMAKACISHDSHAELSKIQCPTLIIGGKQDKIVTGEASEEMAKAIAGSKLYMYEKYGHGLYEEAKDFNERVITFFRGDNFPG